MAHLPPEILVVVLKAAFDVCDRSLQTRFGIVGRRKWLASALRVSHMWAEVGTPHLYRQIDIDPDDEELLTMVDCLLTTFKRRPHLAALVRTLRFVEPDFYRRRRPPVSFGPGSGPVRPTEADISRFNATRMRVYTKLVVLQDLCTQATTLVLSSHGIVHFDITPFPIRQNIECIEIDLASYWRDPMTSGAWRLFSVLARAATHLRSLRLGLVKDGYNVVTEVEDSIPSLNASTLTSKVWNGVDLPVLENLELFFHCDLALLRNLLHMSRHSLRSLRIGSLLHTAGLEVLPIQLEPVRAQLVSLRFLMLACDTVLPDLSFLSNLTHLTIDAYIWSFHRILTPPPGYMTASINCNLPRKFFPPSLRCMTWSYPLGMRRPWDAAQRLHETLVAVDRRDLSKLQRVVIEGSFCAWGQAYENEIHTWGLIGYLAHNAARCRGVICEINVRVMNELYHPKEPVDGFARRELENIEVRRVDRAMARLLASRTGGFGFLGGLTKFWRP